MKEENGNLKACTKYLFVSFFHSFVSSSVMNSIFFFLCCSFGSQTSILGQGLFYCPHNESLLVKGIKHSEKMGDINCARYSQIIYE